MNIMIVYFAQIHQTKVLSQKICFSVLFVFTTCFHHGGQQKSGIVFWDNAVSKLIKIQHKIFPTEDYKKYLWYLERISESYM